MKKIICIMAFVTWTLICIYGTYYNTIENASVTKETATTYEITYYNTNETHVYSK